jgi:predicted RNA methylase
MKLKQLESALQQVDSFENAKLNYEQYITTPHLASQIVYSIESQFGDINESVVCDLGIGTGMLSIGCSLMGADLVYGVDIDKDALAQCSKNIDHFDITNIELINADCKQLLKLYDIKKNSLFSDIEFDTIVMNPPFGTKYQSNGIFEKDIVKTTDKDTIKSLTVDSTLGIDMQFLKLASKMAKKSIYSLNKTCTRDFIRKFSLNLGLKMEVISELRYNIPKVENRSKIQQKTKTKDKDIEVDFIRFSFL